MSLISSRIVCSRIMCEVFIYRVIVFFFLVFLFPNTVAAQNCSDASCGSSRRVPIRFPFYLEGNQSQNCGYPGFHLSCSSFYVRTALKLPNSGDEFLVRNISYVEQQINLRDPRRCMMDRLMKLNLSESPYSIAHVLNFMLLRCPSNPSLYFYRVVDCLSNRTDTVLAISDKFWASYMMSTYSCAMIATVPVPVSGPMKEESGYSVDVNENNLQLSWATPDCKACEKAGGTCGFKNYTLKEIGCFNQRTGDRRSQIARIVSLTITLPAVICGIGIACSRCCRNSANTGPNESNRSESESEQRALQPAVVMAIGLSEKTIQSFKKLELGESRRITGPNGLVCPICLSEYLPKEILKCLPECNHCFHAECIDPWLRVNQKCPLCRNSPRPTA